MKTRETEIVIVGAGAAGSLAALRLAKAGKKVLALEAGPPWRTQDLVSSQIYARRLKWGGAFVASEGANRLGHNMATGWGYGGAATHHYANWPRLTPEDFALRSRHGEGADWPFGYETLRPHYDAIQAEIGLSGDAAAEIWRPPGAPYPHPPIQTFPQAEALARGFAARGWTTAPVPLAILTEPREGREACIYDGWCDAGCPTGALANPLVTTLRAAAAAGAEFRAHAQVTRILHENGKRATGVLVADTRTGEVERIDAALVIVAASAIQTPRLLFASAGPGAENGLANATGRLGQGFMAHALINAHGVFDRDLQNYLGVSGGNLVCRDGYAKTPAPGAFGSHEWVLGAALKPNDLIGVAMTRPDLSGQALADFMQKQSKRLGVMGALIETVPRPENRVELTPEKDRFGVPLAKVAHALGPKTLALVDHVRAEGEALMRAAGAGEVWTGPIVTLHALGGAPMGRDPASSIVNEYGQSWEAPNLVLLGGMTFPTIGAAGPTFTIHAVADRALAHIVQNWSSIAG